MSTPAQLGGFAASAPTLAAAYARAGEANAVVEPVARRLDLDPATVRTRINASQVPQTPVIRIDALGESPRSAIRLANAAARNLVTYAGDLNASNQSADEILTRYRRAERTLARARLSRGDAERLAEEDDSSKNQDDLLEAESDVASAQLRVDVLRDAYRNSQLGLGSANPLSLLEEATEANTNRRSRAQLLGFTGLVGGFVVGCALALALGARRRR